ncbi:MAG TPA: pirin family protein [Polyangiaceae bacterium]|nr:pirin family protein [Polyangiaceae bacterium]
MSIELVLEARSRDLGGFVVQRVLPSPARRLVGPFIFFDHFGPIAFEPGRGMNVRPHPHIGLATVSYLFDGEIVHRDSLGSLQPIRPGDVNWMTAGRGIVHSERTSPERLESGASLHGIQSWVALPLEAEESEPRFEHTPVTSLPRVARDGMRLTVVLGEMAGQRSPVRVASPTFYADAELDADASLGVPAGYEERAAYVVSGRVACEGREFTRGTMIVFRPGGRVRMNAAEPARVMLLGGAKLAGERHIFWNFVSSSAERIERAKDDWKAGRFPKVPGDETEFIPLPA